MTDLSIGIFIFLAAILYSSVGHGGASAYLGVMALAGLAPAEMKPAALTLNITVAGVAAMRFARAGHLDMRFLAPFVVASVPMAFLGGATRVAPGIYKVVLGVVLAYAGVRMLTGARGDVIEEAERRPVGGALSIGAAIGWVSGLIGIGGGIFLSPLLLMMGWAGAKKVAATSAVFIVVNSVAGLAGHLLKAPALPEALAWWCAAALFGGWIGSGVGSRQLASRTLVRVLGVVLLLAAAKLALTH